MDTNGIPMAFHTFSGNESEKTNMLPEIQRVKKDYEIDRIIVVADRGLNTSDNTSILLERMLLTRKTMMDMYMVRASVEPMRNSKSGY